MMGYEIGIFNDNEENQMLQNKTMSYGTVMGHDQTSATPSTSLQQHKSDNNTHGDHLSLSSGSSVNVSPTLMNHTNTLPHSPL